MRYFSVIFYHKNSTEQQSKREEQTESSQVPDLKINKLWSVEDVSLLQLYKGYYIPLVKFMCLIFTCMPGEKLPQEVQVFVVCSCDVFQVHLSPFQVLVNSLF